MHNFVCLNYVFQCIFAYTLTKVNTFRNHISLLSAIIVAFGITISSIHIHIDDYNLSETGQSVAQEEVHCYICGSVFKFTPDCDQTVDLKPISEPFLFKRSTESEKNSFFPFHDGRAPPFYV